MSWDKVEQAEAAQVADHVAVASRELAESEGVYE